MYLSSFTCISFFQASNNIFEENKFTRNAGIEVGINYTAKMATLASCALCACGRCGCEISLVVVLMLLTRHQLCEIFYTRNET